MSLPEAAAERAAGAAVAELPGGSLAEEPVARQRQALRHWRQGRQEQLRPAPGAMPSAGQARQPELERRRAASPPQAPPGQQEEEPQLPERRWPEAAGPPALEQPQRSGALLGGPGSRAVHRRVSKPSRGRSSGASHRHRSRYAAARTSRAVGWWSGPGAHAPPHPLPARTSESSSRSRQLHQERPGWPCS